METNLLYLIPAVVIVPILLRWALTPSVPKYTAKYILPKGYDED